MGVPPMVIVGETVPSQTHYLPMQLNRTDLLPLLNLSSTSVERGNSLTVLIALRDKNNASIFYEGIPFFLWIHDVENNVTSSLVNDTTTNGFYNYTLETYFTETPLHKGNYTLTSQFNVTGIGILEVSSSFEVVLNPSAKVLFLPDYTLIDFLKVDENFTITINMENVGAANAFNVSINIQSIDEPVGLIASQFPIKIPLMASQTTFSFNFTVNPTRFGLGKISFLTSYTNAEGISKLGSFSINFRILPRLIASFSPETELFSGNLTKFNLRITNLERANFTISYSLTSDLISFFTDLETNKQLILAGQTISKKVTGAVLKDGLATVTLKVIFFDEDGSGTAEILIITQTFSVSTSPLNVIINNPNPNQWLLVINLLFLVILLASVVILYFKPQLRNQILRKFMAPSVPNYELDTENVIVDGSNVAWERPDNEGKPNLKNIDLAVSTLKQAGFKDILVIVDAALRYQVSNIDEFDKAARSGKIHVMPAKVSADQFILRLAKERNAMVLTNDLFKEFRDEMDDIDEKRIPYTILNGILYLHPLGKRRNE